MSENLPPNQPGQPAAGEPAYRAEPAPAPPQAPGYAAPAAPGYAPPAAVPGKTLGIVGLILSILLPLIGLILSIVAVIQSKKAGAKNIPGIIGIVIGALFTIGAIISIILFVGAMNASLSVLEVCSNDPSASVEVMGQLVPCSSVEISDY